MKYTFALKAAPELIQLLNGPTFTEFVFVFDCLNVIADTVLLDDVVKILQTKEPAIVWDSCVGAGGYRFYVDDDNKYGTEAVKFGVSDRPNAIRLVELLSSPGIYVSDFDCEVYTDGDTRTLYKLKSNADLAKKVANIVNAKYEVGSKTVILANQNDELCKLLVLTHDVRNGSFTISDGSTPIIFLDINGVMDSPSFPLHSDRHAGFQFTPTAVMTLRLMVKVLSAKIVISSSWRIGRTIEELQAIFRVYDDTLADCIIGKTSEDDIHNRRRSSEIQDYINTHSVTSFVILDDDDFDMDDLSPHLVKCDHKKGLTSEEFYPTLEVLRQFNEKPTEG